MKNLIPFDKEKFSKQISDLLPSPWAFPGDTVVENRPSMQEPWVRFLGWGDALEEEMAAHSSILAWRIPWTEEPSRLQSMGGGAKSRT